RPQTLDRRLSEKGAERCVIEGQHIGELRVPYRFAGGEFVIAGCAREFVPRADSEAIVAAKDAITHGLAEFVWDLAFVLDGIISEAFAGIEPEGCRKSVSGADVEAAGARTAAFGMGRIGGQVGGGK